jgi:hypothetical protein
VRVVIYLPFALSALLVGLSTVARRRASPRAAAWTLVSAMVVLAGAGVGALGLLAWPLLARDGLVARLGRWQPGAVSRSVPVPVAVSVLAALALVVVAVSAIDRLRRLREELVATARAHAVLGAVASTTVVVLDDPAPEAAALPGLPGCRGRVLVSTGLLAALDHDERAAVLAHEHAHLAHSHRIFATIAGLAAAVNPILGPVRRDLGFVLERWADEEAAARTAPSVAARAIAKAALVKLSLGRPGSLAGGAVLYVAAVGVPERVAALLGEDGRDGAGPVLWAIAVLVVVAVAATAWATHDTERLFEALRSR